MVATLNSVGLFGLRSFMVEVEADVSNGKNKFDLVGLPDTAVSEAKERVCSAIKNSGYSFPQKHITVNLAPAGIKKGGSVYDLPMLVAILLASGQISFDFSRTAFIGELSLSGNVRGVSGVLPMLLEAREQNIKRIFIPYANANEASVVDKIEVYPVKNTKELLAFLTDPTEDPIEKVDPKTFDFKQRDLFLPDFSEVKGQKTAKRALEVAAAGGHNVLMIGPPGSGKSMLAKRLPSILPDMSFDEALETTKIYSIAGQLGNKGLITERPFRSPHHTVSNVGLSGGGAIPHPGEISLAHNGVLFLDELPEFSRQAMEVMRQPIEDGCISISRASGALSYPCSLMLVAAMNPCPCGFSGHPAKQCTCTPAAAQRYFTKISGPMLDRIDIQIEVPPVDFHEMNEKASIEESSEAIKKRVNAARQIQLERFKGTSITCNAKMTPAQTQKFCEMTDGAAMLVKKAFEKLGLSARAYNKIMKLARTIADLDKSERINEVHVSEAIRYRNLDRKKFLT